MYATRQIGLSLRATGNSRLEGDKFPVLFWKNPENSRLESTTYLQANTSIIARKWTPNDPRPTSKIIGPH